MSLRRLLLGFVVLGALGSPTYAASVNVLTTTTDLADIARKVGGSRVAVNSLCKGPEDPHFLDARPSYGRLVNQAQLVIVTGMELEVAYMPLLLRDAVNPRVRPGAAGYLDASSVIAKKLQVPAGPVSRAMGDIHPYGNPHYLMDPVNAPTVANAIAAKLAELDPEGATAYTAGAAAFKTEIENLVLGTRPAGQADAPRQGGLLRDFAPHKDAGLVTYHDDLIYFVERLKLKLLGALEPKPGIPPTASHVDALSRTAKAAGVKIVIYRTFQPMATAQRFAASTGAKVVLIAHQPNATPDSPDLISMYRRNARVLLEALGGAPK
jgi:ABC-type Zn uptake system ZnuABC Zn-binding protein ZnuA